ncbi:MAG: L-fucose/L-arabinose isomerase family protein [Candidatus Atribacteria bacterium]|nr:L-fucose/L-arabinose isomerase family protein [Candidatus Atribacteria bacterium]
MGRIKMGFITTMSEDETWPQAIVDEFTGKHREAKKVLESLGWEVVAASTHVGRTFSEMGEQARSLREKGVHVLVLLVPDWTYSSHSVTAGLNIGVPVLVWSDDSPGHSGIVGGSIVRGALDEVGVMTTLVHGRIGDPVVLKRIERWCRGVAAATQLRNTRIGLGGSRSMGMYTAHVDPSEIMKQFGIDIDGWEQTDLIRRSLSISPAETEKVRKWMEDTFGRGEVKEEVMTAQINLYLALCDLIVEKRYDAVCVKCLPELPTCYTTFCLTMALLNDRSDHRGPKESIVCGCEADVNGTLTMQILKSLDGGPAMFTDVQRFYKGKNEVGMMNCGSSATDFAASKKEVFWVREGLLEFQWKMGAACPQYVTRAGRVTLARLGRIDGQYIMLITGGEAVAYPREKLRDLNPQHPQSYIRLDCSIDRFVENLRSNHIHFVFGDYVEELKTTCEVLHITPIIP